MQKVVTSFNLNTLLKLFFYSPISTNNNLLLKIYCKNIVVTFLKQDFLFFILFLISLFSFHPYVFFFLRYLLHTRCPISIPTPSFSFSPSFKSQERSSTLILSFFPPVRCLSLSLSFLFLFLLDSRTVVPNAIQMGHLRPKAIGPAGAVAHLHPQRSLNGLDGFYLLSFVFLFFLFFLLLLL